MKTDAFRIVLVIAIMFGIAIRLFAMCLYEPEHGSVLQAAMAKSFLETSEFMMEYGPVMDSENHTKSISHHFPPFYPTVIAMFAGTPNFNLDLLKAVSLRLMLITAIAIFLVTRNIFGQTSSLFVTAIWILHAAMIDNSAKCLSENLQILLLITFLYLFHLSRKTAWILVPTGFALGIAFLSKSTLPFIPVVLLVGYGLVILSIKNHKMVLWGAGAFIAFLFPVVSWGFRNYEIHKNLDTSPYIGSALIAVLLNPVNFVIGIVINFVPMLLVIAIPLILFLSEIKKAKISDPFDFLLLFFSLCSFVFSLCYVASFYVIESAYLPVNSMRYSLISVIPLMWLIVKYIDWNTQSAIKRAQITVVIAFVSAVSLLTWAGLTPDKPLLNEQDIALSKNFVDLVQEKKYGKTVKLGFDSQINKNDFYYYLFAFENKFGYEKTIDINYVNEMEKPDIIISIPDSDTPDGFIKFRISNSKRVMFIRDD